jgi:phenylalanyl-tRNA synthetase beta chain
VLGYPVSAADAARALERIGIDATDRDGILDVEAPSFRPDLEGEEDLIEEVVRVQGYDLLPSTIPGVHQVGGEQDSYRIRRRVRELLVRAGLREAASLTFASGADVALMGHDGAVRVANPPSAEEPFLRTSLVPRLVEAASRNRQRGVDPVALFEVGHVFGLGDPVDEREHAAVVLVGTAGEGVHAESRLLDAIDAKGVVEELLDGLGVGWEVDQGAERPFHAGRSGRLLVEGRSVGVVGELHPAVAERLDLVDRVAVAEVDVTALPIRVGEPVTFRDVPRFPPVRRDLAVIVAEEVPVGTVHAAIRDAAGDLLGRSHLFDVFRGGAVPAGRKSLAFALEFRAADRTLTDREIEPVIEAIVERLGSDLDATLRA